MIIKLNYLHGDETMFKPADKYWAQLQVNSGFTENIFKLMRAIGNHSPTEVIKTLEYLIENIPQFWSTYKQNFLAGQVLYTFTQIKIALVHSALPEVLGISMFWAFAQWDESTNTYYLTGRDFSNYLEKILLIIGPNTSIGKVILDYVEKNHPQYYEIVKKTLEVIESEGKQFIDGFVREIFPNLDEHITWPKYSARAQQVIRDWANLNSSIFQVPVHIQGYQYGEIWNWFRWIFYSDCNVSWCFNANIYFWPYLSNKTSSLISTLFFKIVTNVNYNSTSNHNSCTFISGIGLQSLGN